MTVGRCYRLIVLWSRADYTPGDWLATVSGLRDEPLGIEVRGGKSHNLLVKQFSSELFWNSGSRPRPWLRIQVILCRILLVSLVAMTAAGADLQITVRLVNGEAIPSRIRRAGEQTAATILAAAGIELVWLDCGSTIPSPCGKALEPGEFWLHLVTGKPPRSLPDAAGFAVLYPTTWGKDGYAGVFYQMVTAIASSEECDTGHMLGATIAHELGHLLLGSKTHSATGVMRARLKRAEIGQAARGGLRFTEEQTESIRRAWGCDNSPNGCRIPKS